MNKLDFKKPRKSGQVAVQGAESPVLSVLCDLSQTLLYLINMNICEDFTIVNILNEKTNKKQDSRLNFRMRQYLLCF